MISRQLKSGDKAMVDGVFSQAERGLSEKGLADALEKAGLKVERLEITRRRIPTRRSRCRCSRHVQKTRPQGDRHAAWRRHGRAAGGAEEGRQEPARSRRRHRPRAGDDRRPEVGYVSVTLTSCSTCRAFMPVVQCLMTAKYKIAPALAEHRAGVVTEDDRRPGERYRSGIW